MKEVRKLTEEMKGQILTDLLAGKIADKTKGDN
jgi:hypothetical protein